MVKIEELKKRVIENNLGINPEKTIINVKVNGGLKSEINFSQDVKELESKIEKHSAEAEALQDKLLLGKFGGKKLLALRMMNIAIAAVAERPDGVTAEQAAERFDMILNDFPKIWESKKRYHDLSFVEELGRFAISEPKLYQEKVEEIGKVESLQDLKKWMGDAIVEYRYTKFLDSLETKAYQDLVLINLDKVKEILKSHINNKAEAYSKVNALIKEEISGTNYEIIHKMEKYLYENNPGISIDRDKYMALKNVSNSIIEKYKNLDAETKQIFLKEIAKKIDFSNKENILEEKDIKNIEQLISNISGLHLDEVTDKETRAEINKHLKELEAKIEKHSAEAEALQDKLLLGKFGDKKLLALRMINVAIAAVAERPDGVTPEKAADRFNMIFTAFPELWEGKKGYHDLSFFEELGRFAINEPELYRKKVKEIGKVESLRDLKKGMGDAVVEYRYRKFLGSLNNSIEKETIATIESEIKNRLKNIINETDPKKQKQLAEDSSKWIKNFLDTHKELTSRIEVMYTKNPKNNGGSIGNDKEKIEILQRVTMIAFEKYNNSGNDDKWRLARRIAENIDFSNQEKPIDESIITSVKDAKDLSSNIIIATLNLNKITNIKGKSTEEMRAEINKHLKELEAKIEKHPLEAQVLQEKFQLGKFGGKKLIALRMMNIAIAAVAERPSNIYAKEAAERFDMILNDFPKIWESQKRYHDLSFFKELAKFAINEPELYQEKVNEIGEVESLRDLKKGMGDAVVEYRYRKLSMALNIETDGEFISMIEKKKRNYGIIQKDVDKEIKEIDEMVERVIDNRYGRLFRSFSTGTEKEIVENMKDDIKGNLRVIMNEPDQDKRKALVIKNVKEIRGHIFEQLNSPYWELFNRIEIFYKQGSKGRGNDIPILYDTEKRNILKNITKIALEKYSELEGDDKFRFAYEIAKKIDFSNKEKPIDESIIRDMDVVNVGERKDDRVGVSQKKVKLSHAEKLLGNRNKGDASQGRGGLA